MCGLQEGVVGFKIFLEKLFNISHIFSPKNSNFGTSGVPQIPLFTTEIQTMCPKQPKTNIFLIMQQNYFSQYRKLFLSDKIFFQNVEKVFIMQKFFHHVKNYFHHKEKSILIMQNFFHNAEKVLFIKWKIIFLLYKKYFYNVEKYF